MAERIPQHVHCSMCWKAISPEDKFCSDECKQKFLSIQKKRRYIWYFLLAIFVVLLVVTLYTPK